MSIKKGNKVIAGAPLEPIWGTVSGDIQDQADLLGLLDTKADVNSATLTGTPTAPTPPEGSDDDRIATTSFVQTAIDNVDALPSQSGHSGQYLTTDGTDASWTSFDESNLVHKSGDETIDGQKTFTGDTIFTGEYGAITLKDSSGTYSDIQFQESDGSRKGMIRATSTENQNKLTLSVGNSSGTLSDGLTFYISNTDSTNTTATFTSKQVRLPTPTENNTTSTQADTVGARNTALQGYANTSLSNLSADGQMIIDSQNGTISNCILDIPQNLKLTLENGVFTIKAGTVLTGTGTTDRTLTTTQDRVVDYNSVLPNIGNGKYVILVGYTNTASVSSGSWYPISKCLSGDILPDPTTISQNTIFYLTTDRKIYIQGNQMATGVWTETNLAYPLGIFEVNNHQLSFAKDSNGNDMIFNGAGYIGHHAFVLPGVKALIPNGFNDDGSLKSIEYSRNNLSIHESVLPTVQLGYKTLSLYRPSSSGVYISAYAGEVEDISQAQQYGGQWYIKNKNIVVQYNSTTQQFDQYTGVYFLKYVYDGTSVTQFDIRQPVKLATTEMLDKVQEQVDTKQDILVSGTNIKTINNNSILGSGNIDTHELPSQSGQYGKFLTTNGTTTSWETVDALPTQAGNANKFLTTDGNNASWATVDTLPSQTGQSGKFLTTNGTTASWVAAAIDESNLVHKTGNETIGGNKTFTGSISATDYTGIVKGDNYLEWGGPNLQENVSPSDAGCIDDFGHNKAAYWGGKIDIEYTTDGTTWLDYGANDTQKWQLTTLYGYDVVVGKGTKTYSGGTLTNDNIDKVRARITLHVKDANNASKFYSQVKKILLNIATCGASGTRVKVSVRTLENYLDNVDVWVDKGTYDVKGWSAWNSIPFDVRIGGYDSQSGYYADIRLEIWSTAVGSSTSAAMFKDIRIIGVTNWIVDDVAKTGHLYNYDVNKNVTFTGIVYGKTPSQDTTSSTQLDTVGARNIKLQSYQTIANLETSLSTSDTKYPSSNAVKLAIDTAISSVYKPAGSIAFANLPTLGSAYEGYVYNISDAFTTTTDFVEGAGHSYPAGTNIVCINTATSGTAVYKWDVLAGFIDLSPYALDANVVHKSGNETISGIKTFNSSIKETSVIDNTSTSGSLEKVALSLVDKNDNGIASYIAGRFNTRNSNELRIKNASGNWFDLRVNVDDSGKGWISTEKGQNISNGSLTDATASTSDETIPTKGWVNNPTTSTNVVHRSGDETIGGIKTFTSTPLYTTTAKWQTPFAVILPNVDYTVNPSEQISESPFAIRDKNNKHMAYLCSQYNTDGSSSYAIIARARNTSNTSDVNSEIKVTAYKDGTVSANAPTPFEDTTSSTQIDTVGARNTKLASYALDANVVHKTGAETIAGVKTFSDNMNANGTITVGQHATLSYNSSTEALDFIFT